MTFGSGDGGAAGPGGQAPRVGGGRGDRAQVFAAILARPDDVDLRLRYAAAVQGGDPEHAELIRLQVDDERDRLAHRLPDPARSDRIDILLDALAPRLTAPVVRFVTAAEVYRGFVELVKLPATDFLDAGEEIARRAPLRHLRLSDAAGHAEAVANSPVLRRLISLDLSGNPIGDRGVAALARSPYLARLRWLGLVRCDAGAAGAKALAASTGLPGLQYLAFAGNEVDLTPYAAGIDWDGTVQDVELPPLGAELVRRYGPKPWLSLPTRSTLFWPPRWDEV